MIEKLFKSSLPSCTYVFADGSRADFISGRFSTADEGKIKELEANIAAKHPHIFVDAEEPEVDTEKQDPLEGLRKKFIAEYLASQAAKEGTDFGNTDGTSGEGAGTTTSAVVADGAKESLGAKIVVGPKVAAK